MAAFRVDACNRAGSWLALPETTACPSKPLAYGCCAGSPRRAAARRRRARHELRRLADLHVDAAVRPQRWDARLSSISTVGAEVGGRTAARRFGCGSAAHRAGYSAHCLRDDPAAANYRSCSLLLAGAERACRRSSRCNGAPRQQRHYWSRCRTRSGREPPRGRIAASVDHGRVD